MTESPLSDSLDIRAKRLLYRSWHRGCKETDLLLGRFAEQHLSQMVEEELSQYEEILECDDWDIFHWLTGDVPIPANLDNSVMRNLKGFQFSQ